MDDKTVIDDFWNSAYRNLKDGGYISNDEKLNAYRFIVEDRELRKFIQKYTNERQRVRALDVGCGNGKFSEVLAQYFKQVDAIDIAQSVIEENRKNNKDPKVAYYRSTLEAWIEKTEYKYDFIYVGGAFTYIKDVQIILKNDMFSRVLNPGGIVVLRESVMTKESVDNISENYIAYYRFKAFYSNLKGVRLVTTKENLAYRVGELRNVLDRLKLGFLFRKNIYAYLLKCLKCKDLIWKPHLNKLVNYYYIFRKDGE